MGKQPTKVKEIPAGYKKGEFRDGIQYWEIEESTPKIERKANPPKDKSKPSTGKPTKKPFLPPPPTKPTYDKKEVFMEEEIIPKKQETVLNNSVKAYGKNVAELSNTNYDVMDFPDETGNYTNNATRLYFDKSGNEIATPDVSNYNNGVFTPKLTGRKIDDIRLSQGVQQINQATDSGLNKRIDMKAPFIKKGSVIDVNSQGGQGITPNTVNKTVTGTTDVYIPKKYDSLGKEIPTNSGLKPIGTPLIEGKEVGKMYDTEEPTLIKGKFAKGGIVSKIKGYYDGGPVNPYQVKNTETQGYNTNVSGNPNIQGQGQQFTNTGNAKTSDNFYSAFGADKGASSGVVGQNDPYAAQKAKEDQDAIDEEKKKKNQQKARNVANGIGEGMGGLGSAYYNSQPTQNEGEATRNVGLAATSQMGGIGGMIGGIAALGDKLGKPTRTSSEKVDASGNLVDENKAKRNAAIGIAFSPSKRLTYEGGLTDVTGQKYLDSIESKTKKQLQQVKNANQTSRQQQAILARDANNENPTITNPYNLTGATFDENQNLVLANNQQYDPNRVFNKGGLVSKVKKYADGGEIKGKGGPKDDKIKAEVKEGSFVVPAENAELAKGIRKLYLKAPNKKANLKQEEGEPVKLSNGEHLFTPEENEYLESIGVNLEALAPNAEEGNRKVLGGEVDEVDPIKELARLNKEKEDAIKAGKIESDAAKAARDKKIADFNAKVESYDKKADRKSKIASWEKKYNDSKTKLDALNKSYEDASKSFEAANTPTAAQKAKGIKAGALTETQRKYKESLLKKIQEAKSEFDNADRTYKYVKDDNNYDASGNIKTKPKTATVAPKTEVKPTVVTENVAPTKPSLKAPSVKKKESVVVETMPSINNTAKLLNQDNELRANNDIVNAEKSINNTVAKQEAINANLEKNNTDYIAKNKPKGKGLADYIGNIDPTAFVGIGQSALGLNMLGKEKRPIDKAVIDPTYNAAVNRAQQDARTGLTPEQKFMAEQEIQGGLNDAKFAGLNSSGVQSFNLNRAAINDAWKNKLGLKQADTEMRMNKQKYADTMASDRANILAYNRRQAFKDSMDAFQQKQQAGSELIGAGLANTIGAYRFKKDQEARQKADEARGYSLNNYNPSV